jgi:predicted aldo/keto reductase-like oxidoreductase
MLKACASKKVGVTLMKTNPVNVYKRWNEGWEEREASGREIPDRVKDLQKEYQAYLVKSDGFRKKYGLKSDEQVRDAAIKFCLSHPGVHSVCPTINDFDMLETFVKLSGQKLEEKDTSILGAYGASLGRYYCRHGCGTCEGSCPKGVPVNTILRYNHYFEAQGFEKYALAKYADLPGSRSNAAACTDCPGTCESACPHGVPVQSLLVSAHQNLTLV